MLYYYSVSTRSFEHTRAHTYAKVITRALYYVISGRGPLITGRGRDVPDRPPEKFATMLGASMMTPPPFT